MSIHPQYTFDNMGNPVGVFLPMADWNSIKKKYPDVEDNESELPQWQKEILDQRRVLSKDPSQYMSLHSFLKEVEDGAL